MFFAAFFVLVILPSAGWSASISGVKVEIGAKGERITLTTSEELAHKRLFRLNKPERIAIDFPKADAAAIALPIDYKGSLLAGIRFGQFSEDTSRLVLDLTQEAEITGSYAVEPETPGQAWQYVLDIKPAAEQNVASNTPPVIPAAPAPAAQIEASPAPFTAQQREEAVAAQNQKPLIVLDAGHGGQDPGAIGTKKTYEKHITLRVAKTLREELLRTGRYRVMLTRDDDTFIALGDRVQRAREAKGDLFISIHADSNPRPEARGFSIYTLSETASDAEAEALAAQENKADIIGGLDLNTQDEDVASILIDLAQRETMNKSTVLADIIVDAMHPKVLRLPQPHRYAGFRVLKAPDIPSVLMELGFLSNREDEQLLLTREYETIISQSVVKAIDTYFAKKPSAL
jgi:N-acetylmuramoyl-L-alanine amidase